MHDMKLSWVAKKYFYNGYPMTIQQFTSPSKVTEIIAFYQRIWQVKGSGLQSSRQVKNRYYLAYEENGYSFSIQVESTNEGSKGMLVTTLNRFYDLGPVDLPIAEGSRLISRTHSQDAEYIAETLVISSVSDMRINTVAYEQWLERHGWVKFNATAELFNNQVLYEKRNRLCQISDISSSHSSRHTILIHLLTLPGGSDEG